jgi:hypothetical protein
MKDLLPSTIRPKTSTITSFEEAIPTVDEDKETISSSTVETTTTSEISEEHPMKGAKSGAEIQGQEDVLSQVPIDKLTSVVTDAISTVQNNLPTSIISTTDVHQQKVPSDDNEIQISESTVSR